MMAKSQTPTRPDAPNPAQNQRRAKAARGRLRTGASGMLPEPGVWDRNSANGMAGTIASTTVLDIMNLGRTKWAINRAFPMLSIRDVKLFAHGSVLVVSGTDHPHRSTLYGCTVGYRNEDCPSCRGGK